MLAFLKDHQELAAWVQAIGSILAIAAAIWISSAQSRRDYKRRLYETRRAMQAVYAIADHARAFLEGLAEQRERDIRTLGDDLRGEVRTLEDISTALVAIPLHTLPSYVIVEGIIEMRRLMVETHRAIGQKDLDEIMTTYSVPEQFRRRAARAQEACNAIWKAIDDLG